MPVFVHVVCVCVCVCVCVRACVCVCVCCVCFRAHVRALMRGVWHVVYGGAWGSMLGQEAPSEMEFLRLLRLLKLLRLHRLLRVTERIHRKFPKGEYVVTACELLLCMMLMAHWMVHTFSKVFSRVALCMKCTRALSFKN
jgi:hypothetical protein